MSEDPEAGLDPTDDLGWQGNPDLYREARGILSASQMKPEGYDGPRALEGPVSQQRQQAVVLRAEMDFRAAQMRARRMSYGKIAQVLGLGNARAAQVAVARGLAAGIDTNSVLEQRELVLQHYDQMTEVVWEVLRANHLTVSNGKVVRLGKEPLRDVRPILEAVDRLAMIERDRAMITGVRAPKQTQVMFTHESVDAAIAALEAKTRLSGTVRGGFGGPGSIVEADVLEDPPGDGGGPGESGAPELPDGSRSLDHDEDQR